MKVLFVSEYYPPFAQGGGERSAKKLIDSVSKNLETKVISSNKVFEVTDWRRFIYNSLYMVIRTYKLGKNFDIVHCLNSTSIYTVLLKPIIKKPFVIHVNSYANLCPKGTLIWKDQSARRECDVDCRLKTCINCCSESSWVGIQKMKISRYLATFLWLRYRFHLFLLKRFDMMIAISKQVRNVLYRKGFTKVELIYYGLDK